jgi:hypothetical protein
VRPPRRFTQATRWSSICRQIELCLPWSCTTLQSIFPNALAPVSVGCSPLAPGPKAELQGFHAIGPREKRKANPRCPLMGSCSPTESSEHRAAVTRKRRHPSSRFPSPSAYSHVKQRLLWPGLPHPTACTLRFSQPHGASIRPTSAGLVSCQIRSWGCALQSFVPLTQLAAVPGPLALMTSGSAPLWLSVQPPARRDRNPTAHDGRNEEPKEQPRLQGFPPRESPPHETGGLGRARRVALLGFRALQGSPPHQLGTTSAVPPLMSFLAREQASQPALSRVSIADEVGSSLSRLPTLLSFFAF